MRISAMSDIDFRPGLKRRMDEKGFSARALSLAAGLGASAVNDILNFRSKSPGTETLQKIVGVLGCTIDELYIEPPDDPQPDRPFVAERLPFARLPDDIEMLGTSVGGEDGEFALVGGTGERVHRPSGLFTTTGVFALYVVGDSMEPRFCHGDLLYMSATRHPAPGDDVVIEMYGSDGEPGPCYIKRLVRRGGGKIRLKQFNPLRDDISFPLDRVKTVYRIFTLNELMGA